MMNSVCEHPPIKCAYGGAAVGNGNCWNGNCWHLSVHSNVHTEWHLNFTTGKKRTKVFWASK